MTQHKRSKRMPFYPVLARFEAKVEKQEAGCWEYTGARYSNGYGAFSAECPDGARRNRLAHRVAWELFRGPIPEGLTLDHLCRNRACVNPEHLEPVTLGENLRRGEGPTGRHARQTHCLYGHPFEGANLYVDPKGSRRCRTCAARQLAGHYARKAERLLTP